MRLSRRTWANAPPRRTFPVAAMSLRSRLDKRRRTVVTKPETRDDRAPEELDEQKGEELPGRKAMSLIEAIPAGPGNAAAALTILSDASTAVAEEQPQDPEQGAGR
jgi:hypothetical protein